MHLCSAKGWSQSNYVVHESSVGYSFSVTVNGQEFTGAVSPFTYRARESVAEKAYNALRNN
ncbi:hypothetical protein HI914_06727 [Erysiphe necator]|nr:hypothetical protein HI914_06727 [Erysiphe necator]